MAKTLDERLVEIRARREAIKLTDAEIAKNAKREEVAREEAILKEEEETRRAMELADRLDVANDRLGGVAIRELMIKDSEHTFIVKDPGAKAYNDWERGIAKSVTVDMGGNGKIDRPSISRTFAVAAVVDWNGIADFSEQTTHGHELIEFFKAHPSIVSEILNVAVELGKQAKEARKSGG